MALHMICVRITPEAPTSEPAMISTELPSTKPGGRGGQAGVGVQQGDDHRHVGPADGIDQRQPEHRGQTTTSPSRRQTLPGCMTPQTHSTMAIRPKQGVDRLQAGIVDTAS